jgi:membrane-associated phospholipid phosphatase
MTLWVSREGKESRAWQAFLILLWVEWVLLCISILTTKQHYLFDLVTGIAVAQFVWVATKRTMDEIGTTGALAFAEVCGWND